MLKVLFITWDGPQTSYMEGLFMPIFAAVAEKMDVEFHVLQFSWASNEKIKMISQVAEEMGVQYSFHQINRNLHPVFGTLASAWKGKSTIRKYVKDELIDVVMPRSTFPAIMSGLANLGPIKIIFDADGFPLEERVEFSGLNSKGFQYRLLKKLEKAFVRKADVVLVRSKQAIVMHKDVNPDLDTGKFVVVKNGRNPDQFKPCETRRIELRTAFKYAEHERVFVYCGSLGPQYEFDDMLKIFSTYEQMRPAKFLILTGNIEYATTRLPESLIGKIKVLNIPFQDVPFYLNTADIAFALRRPSYSMQGVAPIKIGEYLLTGIPTIASKGIGDTEAILAHFPDSFLYDHDDPQRIQIVVDWLLSQDLGKKSLIRQQAMSEVSLSAAADSYINAFRKVTNEGSNTN